MHPTSAGNFFENLSGEASTIRPNFAELSAISGRSYDPDVSHGHVSDYAKSSLLNFQEIEGIDDGGIKAVLNTGLSSEDEKVKNFAVKILQQLSLQQERSVNHLKAELKATQDELTALKVQRQVENFNSKEAGSINESQGISKLQELASAHVKSVSLLSKCLQVLKLCFYFLSSLFIIKNWTTLQNLLKQASPK